MNTEMPHGWVNTSYQGFGIKKRVVGGPAGLTRRDAGRRYDFHRNVWVPAYTYRRARGTRKYTRVLVFRHGIVVNRFLTMKRAREWIRCQQ